MSKVNKKTKGYHPVVLAILDGWGINKPYPGNAIELAHKPNFDFFKKNFSSTSLLAHGHYVGLPSGQDGNSEAGHLNLGTGRVVLQEAVIVNAAIKDGTFFKNSAFKRTVEQTNKKPGRSVHLIGLLTGWQSAHADPAHILALLKFYRQHKVKNVFIHLFTDGRDSYKYGAFKFLAALEKNLLPHEKIATVSGRYYAMDRKDNWERTKKVYQAMVFGQGKYLAHSAKEAIERAYERGETDEFILPTVIVKHGKCDKSGLCISGVPIATIKSSDSVVFFNLRSDRARELVRFFKENRFHLRHVNNGGLLLDDLVFVTMTDYGLDLENVLAAFPSQTIINSLPAVLKDLRQLYIAETEKYAHITYFFNGGYMTPVDNEQQKLIASPNVPTYDVKPQMSAYEITDYVVKSLQRRRYDFIAINFANPDMVGHTGNLAAGIKAVESVDQCLEKIYQVIKKNKGLLVITADHGNAEEMINKKTGEEDTQHSSFPVPFIIIDERFSKRKRYSLKKKGILANVAPTILQLMNRVKPLEMTAESLIIK